MSINYNTVFNDHFMEFVSDIQTVFPEDPDILSAHKALGLIRKSNPKILVQIWKTFIVGKYEEEINQGNIDFFVNKDYSQDFSSSDFSEKITQAIDRLREPVKSMNKEDQEKTMKYIQNLTKLSKFL